MPGPEFHLFLPQMRLEMDDIVERALAAEAAGFAGLALMDHLVPPAAEGQPMFEALTTATWVAARTSRLVVGHLVLCDAVRHPAVLARQAVTIDRASGGRFELGIGSGSTPGELHRFGIEAGSASDRTGRLAETLEVVTRLWTGEVVDFAGRFHRLDGACQQPVPTRPIPIVVGGTSAATMELVSRYATWWNVPAHQSDRLRERRARAGQARPSLQQLVTFVATGADREAVTGLARRRFGWMTRAGSVEGTGPELVDRFAALRDGGVERLYVWFTDFAPPATLEAFGHEVIAPLAASS